MSPSEWWILAVFFTLLTTGVAALFWPAIQSIVGGATMKDFIQRITSREFIAVGALIGYTFLITISGYAVPEYVKTVLVPAILMFAGYMAITGRKNGS